MSTGCMSPQAIGILLAVALLVPGLPASALDEAFQDDLQALAGEIAARSPAGPQLDGVSPIFDADLAPVLDLSTAVAQIDDGPSPSFEISGDEITLNFQEADINALISTVSQITGRNFIVDPRVKGRVTLISGTPLDTRQVYDVFLSVLEVHGFAAVDAGGLTKILPANIIKQTPTRTSVGQEIHPSDEQVTQVYRLKHASVQEMTPILRPLLPPTSHFAPHIGSNTLLFTDTAANISRVLKIVGILDQPDTRSDIHVVMVQHANATRLGDVVRQVASSLQREQGEGGGQPPSVSVQVDEGLNALIIQAPDNEFTILEALIGQLDVKRAREGNIHVVYLRYAKAEDLVSILSEIAADRQQGDAEQTARASEVSVQADNDTNALVIRAEEEDYEELRGVIEKLDLRRSQVFVETIIAEVSNTKAAEIGVEWQGLHSKTSGGEVSVGSGFSDGGDGGLTVGYINKFVTDLAGNILPDLNIVLRALRNDNNANILSTPNLLTLDNESAEIVVGQEVPFVTGQYVSDASTTGTGDGSTTGVVNPFQTIERKNVGLTLKITPQINEGGAIRLEIEQEISSVSPTTVSGASDLITNTRSINATVLVDDGQIIVLGGLITDDISDTFEWVPVLGKIPLLGALFRKKSKQAVKRNLMVFLRPKIIRTPADLFEHTKAQYENIQSQQRASLPDTRRMIRGSDIPVLESMKNK
ncbi:MAG: type II secretion system protein GspD [Proteobacteria bacterium]|nr:MAG: type II secretion system protein GspD [Pseudomonadota bacterium]